MADANPLPAKDRLKIPRAHMPELDAETRAHNFEEVNQGLDARAAVGEVGRISREPDPPTGPDDLA